MKSFALTYQFKRKMINFIKESLLPLKINYTSEKENNKREKIK